MKDGLNLNSLKSNIFALGTLLICGSGINFVIIQPSLADTVEQFSSAGIVFKEQSLFLKGTTTNPISEIEDSILNESISSEIRLVVKLKAKRVYVYKGDRPMKSYPIAVGKPGYETPQGSFNIFSREVDPTFKNFKTGAIIPPGKNNPLGVRWIGVWTDGKTQIGFHGTNRPQSIGKAISHGCIRMHNKDVVALYNQVKIGTLVQIVP
ncbi:MAG: L,D-transpeptidase [Cyanobacteria bacterium P01_C01_bin.38]